MSWWPFTIEPRIPLGTLAGSFPKRHVSLPLALARTHWHCIGLSGSGKSTFLINLYTALLAAGQSATLIDPAGDLARAVHEQLVARGCFDTAAGIDRIRFLDLPAAEDAGYFLPFNVLARDDPPSRIVSDILDALHRAFPETAEQPIFNTLLPDIVTILIENRRPLTDAYRLLVDKPFRDALLAHVTSDPDVPAFFVQYFDRLKPQDQASYSGTVVRRLRQLSRLPILKFSLCQPTNALDFRAILAHNVSLLVNLGGLEPDARRLAGALLMVGAEQAALARARTPSRAPHGAHWLIIDEWADFAAQSSEAVQSMLSQTRKFGLFAVLSHQNFTQTSEKLRGALNNCGIELAFALGRDDAQRAAPIVGRVVPKTVRQAVSAGESESAGMAEQLEHVVQTLEDLRAGEAFFYRRGQPVLRLTTPLPRTSHVDPDRVAASARQHLTTHFRPLSAIQAQLAQDATYPVTAPLPERQRL